VEELDKKIAESGIELIADFIKSLIKPSLDQVGEIFADKLKFWRFKNQVKTLLKAQELISEYGIEPKPISVKTLARFLEYSSLEEDEYMQDKWAQLLANAVTDGSEFKANQIYVEILGQLSSIEILVLDNLFKEFKVGGYIQTNNDYSFNEKDLFKYNITTKMNIYTDSADIIYDNLVRMNLIYYVPAQLKYGKNDYVERERIAFTKLGFGFITTCTKSEEEC
jgi:hypothetical protein